MNHGLFVSWDQQKRDRKRVVPVNEPPEYDYLRENYIVFEIAQGDAYELPYHLTFEGDTITDEDVLQVEIAIGTLIKMMPDIRYSAARECWLFPLTQEESMAFPAAPVRTQARIKFNNGNVLGGVFGVICILARSSTDILE